MCLVQFSLVFVVWLRLSVSTLLTTAAAAAPEGPILDAPGFDGSGHILLRVQGDSGANYAIEASTDLKIWWKEFSGPATNGSVEFAFTPPANPGARWFRARTDQILPALNVMPGSDTNNLDAGIAAAEHGTSLSVTNEDGTTFVFSVPAGAVDEPQVFTMTSVTNLTGIPFAAGALGAVVLEPAGLILNAAAELRISFPTNQPVNSDAVAGFAFDNDGGYLRLSFDRPETNGVTIPVFTLGGFGCAVATSAEVRALSERPVGNTNSAASGADLIHAAALRSLSYPVDDCDPSGSALAKQVDGLLDRILAAAVAAIAADSRSTRDSNPTLPRDQSQWTIPWLGNNDAFWHDLYQRAFVQWFSLSEKTCPLNRVIAHQMRNLDSLERQFDPGMQFPDIDDAKPHLCTGYENCVTFIDNCCKQKGLVGQASVDVAKAFVNEATTFRCILSPNILDAVSKDCLPTWSGKISLIKSIVRTLDIDDDLTTVHNKTTENVITVYSTDSTGLTGQAAGGGYYGIQGNLKAVAQFEYRDDTYNLSKNCCAGCITQGFLKSDKVGKGTGGGFFIWHLQGDSSPPLGLPIPNSVVPHNDLVSSSVLDGKGWQYIINSKEISGENGESKCVQDALPPTPVNRPIELASDLAYINFLGDKDGHPFAGTISKFSGQWDTNFVSSDKLMSTTISVTWSFTRN